LRFSALLLAIAFALPVGAVPVRGADRDSAPAANAAAPVGDLHVLFEQRCGRCHEHAGDLARRKLKFDANGALIGRANGEPVYDFLLTHRGGLTPQQAGAFVVMMARQVADNGRFQERCSICHGRAADLARNLIEVDGRLVGRYTGNDIATFLLRHGRLDEDGAAFFLELLRSIRRESGGG
jgi:mono/diheme cytochrome c family protein